MEKVISPENGKPHRMKPEQLITRIPNLTPEEEAQIKQTLENGRKWQDYYKGKHTLIRKDKLAQLNKNTQELRQLQGRTKTPNHNYCQKCGTKTKTMPCDQELTYCPQCDLPHTP